MTIPPDIRELMEGRRSGGSGLRRVIFLAALLALLVPAIAARVADWLWYRDVGFERVFLTMLAAQWGMGLATGLLAFLLLYLNARFALRGVPRRNLHIRNVNEWAAEGPAGFGERLATWFALPGALVVSTMIALAAASSWRDLAQFIYRTPFGVADPVFGRDIGYYVFTVPMLQHALTILNAAGWAALLLFTLGIYVARGDVGAVVEKSNQGVRFFVSPRAQLHLAIIGALLLVLRAVRVQLVDVPSLLLARRAVLFGATYTDLHLRLPMLRVLGAVMVIAAVYLVLQARRGRILRGAVAAFASVVIGAVLLTGVIPNVYQRLVVQPNELARETPQIRHHLSATRQAWGVDSVERRELNSGRTLTMRDIQANQATIRNVRLWDRDPLLQTFGQIQSIRTYYDFVSVDDDRYMVNGELRQVLLAPREMNTAALPTRTFINEHLTYTHGMGVTLGPSNQVTPEGLPVLWIKDLPPVSSIPIRVTRPRIYFGEQSNEFILAPTRQQEFDYPAGEGDAAVYSTYDGGAGVSVGSFARRLLFAFRFRSMNILLSDDLTDSTRILFHRDVLERGRMALPFLRFDSDPYMVIADDGTLKWILDAYTATGRYPYSQPLTDGTNYMRNSVKVVIDAYTGETRAYLADERDPMIRTLGRIYPGMLRPLVEMPADLRAHIRYPGTLFAAQSSIYALFHMSDPATFYGREDQWQIPTQTGAREQSGEAFMRHIVMRLPGESEPEFILMRPFTPRRRDNLAAWMVARNDGENYGKLRVYRFPRQSLVFGPAQIVNRMTQDAEVARQISLWDQRGSEVIRGELLVIPIEESLIYVQPLYLRASGGRIPELRRVVVADERQVAMEETLEEGLAVLFGGAPSSTGVVRAPSAAEPAPATRPADPAAPAPTATNAQLVRDANAAYERARAAQRNEDWATYGAEMRRLGEILRRLRGN